MRLLDVGERTVLKHLVDTHPKPLKRTLGSLGNYALVTIANNLTRYGLVSRIESDGPHSDGLYTITDLGRLHLEHDDLPLMVAEKKMYW